MDETRPKDVAGEGGDEPQPAMNARGRNPAEISADIAAVGQSRAIAEQQPLITAAMSERAGSFQPGLNFPASPAASSAPRMMPKSMTEVISAKTLSRSARARAGVCQ